MSREYDGRLHPVEWAILEANRQLAEEAHRPPLYLQAFLDMVQLTIAFVTCCAEDDRFIQDIVASKAESEDAFYYSYLSALFEYEFLLGAVFILSGLFFVISVFCGFFFVLMRMVGAFGGHKVQNITGYYMLALHLHTASMTLITGLNSVSLAWLYGSSNRLHVAHDYSVETMSQGHETLKSHITDSLSKLKTAVDNAQLTRKDLADSVDSYHKEYLNELPKHANLVLEKAGLPSEKQITDLNEFCNKVSQDQQVPPNDRSKYSTCATTCADLVTVAQGAAQQIQPVLRKAVEDYNSGGPAFKDLQPSNIWKDAANKLGSLVTQVSAAKFPLISDFDILGRLSLYDGIFEYGLDYISQVCVGARLLQALAAFSFAVGSWVHDPEIPPNKRGFVSNQTGITLVVSTLFMWLFTTFMIPASIVYMLSGVIAANYICYPYQYGGDGGLNILDNVTASLYIQGERNYIRNTNYALFNSTYRMGQVLRMCNVTMPLVNLSTHPDITKSSIAFTAHAYPIYFTMLEENKALKAESALSSPSGLVVKLNDAKNALDQLGTDNRSATVRGSIKTTNDAKKVSEAWRDGFATLANDAAYKQAIEHAMNKEYLESLQQYSEAHVRKLANLTQQVFSNVGDCKPIHDFYEKCLDAFCGGTLLSMNGVWFALWLVCGMFTSQIAVGLKLSKYLMRMDDYMYEGVEVEESVDSPVDDKSSGFSVSYAPSGVAAPSGQYKWRRPRYDPKFENNPYHMPELEASVMYNSADDSDMDMRRWNKDRRKEFVIESIADEVKQAKELRAQAPQTQEHRSTGNK